MDEDENNLSNTGDTTSNNSRHQSARTADTEVGTNAAAAAVDLSTEGPNSTDVDFDDDEDLLDTIEVTVTTDGAPLTVDDSDDLEIINLSSPTSLVNNLVTSLAAAANATAQANNERPPPRSPGAQERMLSVGGNLATWNYENNPNTAVAARGVEGVSRTTWPANLNSSTSTVRVANSQVSAGNVTAWHYGNNTNVTVTSPSAHAGGGTSRNANSPSPNAHHLTWGDYDAMSNDEMDEPTAIASLSERATDLSSGDATSEDASLGAAGGAVPSFSFDSSSLHSGTRKEVAALINAECCRGGPTPDLDYIMDLFFNPSTPIDNPDNISWIRSLIAGGRSIREFVKIGKSFG